METYHGRTLGVTGWLLSHLPPAEPDEMPPLRTPRPTARQRRKALLPGLIWLVPLMAMSFKLPPSQYGLAMLVLACCSAAGITPLIVAYSLHSFWPLLGYLGLAAITTVGRIIWLGRRPASYVPAVGNEELDCCEGAEFWSLAQRLKAALIFGLLHIRLIFVPVFVVVCAGAVGLLCIHEYMRVWRRTYGSRHDALQAVKTLRATADQRSAALLLVALPVSGLIEGARYLLG